MHLFLLQSFQLATEYEQKQRLEKAERAKLERELRELENVSSFYQVYEL